MALNPQFVAAVEQAVENIAKQRCIATESISSRYRRIATQQNLIHLAQHAVGNRQRTCRHVDFLAPGVDISQHLCHLIKTRICNNGMSAEN